MKKGLILVALSTLLGISAIGIASGLQYKELLADDDYQTYVPLRDGWIEDTDGSAETNLNDAIRARNDRFWNGNSDSNSWDSQERSFNALDEFIDTIHRANGGEGWRGAYRTPELVLKDNDHRYISFLFGGGSGDIFVNIFQVSGEAGSGDRISGIRTAFDGSGTFDDKEAKLNAPISCNMVFKYFELPSEIQPGDRFLIYVRDGKTENYGGFTFGDVHINQTLEDVAKSFSAHKTQMKLNEYMSDWTRNANEYVLNYYATDDYYATVRAAEADLTSVDDDFEINNRLSKWAYDSQNSTYENGDLAVIDYDGIYGDKEYKWGGYFYENDGLMPLNKTGNKYLTGEPNDVDCNNCGLPESAKYRLISPEFTLSGTGLISAKIGGHYTALQLLDSNYNVIATTGDSNPSFLDANMSNIADSGARQCTMVRTYLDCREYLGQRVHVALADTQTGGGWNLSYFDEIVTKYTSLPNLKIDYFTQTSSKSDNKYNGYILDKYIYDAEKAYNSALKEAYDFLQTYFSTLRIPAYKFDYAYATEDAKDDIYLAYLSLSDGAKEIVNSSDDLQVLEEDNEFNADWWFNTFVQPSQTISIFVPDDLIADVRTVSFAANGGTGEMASVLKLEGKTYILPSCTFGAPEGHEFAGWVVGEDTTIREAGYELTIAGDVTITAQWSLLRFAVTYAANGGEGDNYIVNDVEYGSEHSILALADTGITAPEGKKFVEWNTAEDGTGETIDVSFEVTEDVTFYAIWEDAAQTKIEALNTRSLLSYSYTGNAEDGFAYSDVKIRFGGFITKSLWDELNEESTILSYGVMISLATTEVEGFIGSDTFKDRYVSALAEADSVDAAISAVCDGSKIKNFEFEVSDLPFLYEATQYDVDEDTYAWNLVQKVNASTSLQRTYVAIAYIKTSAGVVFLNESRVSPKSLAQSMLSSDDYSDDSLGGSLKYLAELN